MHDDAAILEIEEDMRVSEEYLECAESEVYRHNYSYNILNCRCVQCVNYVMVMLRL